MPEQLIYTFLQYVCACLCVGSCVCARMCVQTFEYFECFTTLRKALKMRMELWMGPKQSNYLALWEQYQFLQVHFILDYAVLVLFYSPYKLLN